MRNVDVQLLEQNLVELHDKIERRVVLVKLEVVLEHFSVELVGADNCGQFIAFDFARLGEHFEKKGKILEALLALGVQSALETLVEASDEPVRATVVLIGRQNGREAFEHLESELRRRGAKISLSNLQMES